MTKTIIEFFVQLSTDHTNITEQYNVTSSELVRAKNELDTLSQSLNDKEKEISVLQDCVQKLSEVDGEEKTVQLERVQAMLDTTKVQVELRNITEERDRLKDQVKMQEDALDEIQSQNETLQEQIASIELSKATVLQEHQETQLKLKAITEYFEQKETQLHRKIGEEEMVRQRVESREAHAKERADMAEQEREKEK